MPVKLKKPAAIPPAEVYRFRPGFRSELDPQTIGERLEWLQAQKGDEKLTPQDVLEDARDPASPLHTHFDWDDASAAEKFRLKQAGEILTAVRVIRITQPGEVLVPAYIKTTSGLGTPGYIRVAQATAPPNRDRVLAEIINQYYIRSTRDRHLGFSELGPLFEMIDRLRAQHPLA